MGLMHSYESLGVLQTPRSYNALIEVFKFISDVETPIRKPSIYNLIRLDAGSFVQMNQRPSV